MWVNRELNIAFFFDIEINAESCNTASYLSMQDYNGMRYSHIPEATCRFLQATPTHTAGQNRYPRSKEEWNPTPKYIQHPSGPHPPTTAIPRLDCFILDWDFCIPPSHSSAYWHLQDSILRNLRRDVIMRVECHSFLLPGRSVGRHRRAWHLHGFPGLFSDSEGQYSHEIG